MRQIDAQRAAVGGELLDVDQLEPVAAGQALDRDQREVREVLVVDGVELVLGDQPREMRELERDHALGREQARHAGDEVVEVGHLGEHVVADDQVGLPALGAQRLGERDAEELDPGRNALGERDLGHVRGGLDAEHRHAKRQEMLQQIAVVARQLDHQAVRAEREALRDHRAIRLGVGDPAGRVGREVGVFAEDVLRAHVLAELDQKAPAAHQRVEREVRLHRVELLGREEALAQRRHAQIDQAVRQRAAAQAAAAHRVQARRRQRLEHRRAHARSHPRHPRPTTTIPIFPAPLTTANLLGVGLSGLGTHCRPGHNIAGLNPAKC